ncbi:MAG: hypothetical protein JXM70_09250 [Pirellulales bacterium]|nr:hypothetical protein [Pirellulales bacterium]
MKKDHPLLAMKTAYNLITLAVIMVLLCGCGRGIDPRRAAVHGRVTLDGKPLQEGTISFFPTAGNKGAIAGGQIIDGSYDIPRAKGPMSGKNRIEIRAPHKTGRQVSSPGGGMMDEYVDLVPSRYRDQELLKADIQSDSNTLDFKLESTPR